MNIQYDNTTHCKAFGITLHNYIHLNYNNSDKLLLITGETKCEISEILYITSEYEDHLNSGEHKKRRRTK